MNDTDLAGGFKYSSKCVFDDNDEISVGFGDCGSALFSFKHKDDRYTTFSTYIHHVAEINGVPINMMNKYQLDCRMSHVVIKALRSEGIDVSVSIEENDENEQHGLITSQELINTFGLSLEVGYIPGSTESFKRISTLSKLDVGQKIRILLGSTLKSHRFALRDCTAYVKAGDDKMPLYNEFCPTADTSIVGLVWNDFESFDIEVFRIRNADSLTFSCSVIIYPTEDDLPKSCKNRRRRHVESESEESVELSRTIILSSNSVLPSTSLVLKSFTVIYYVVFC